MTSPFIAESELAAALASDNPPAILDASLELHAPAFDGDYRMNSGVALWTQSHIPGSQHVDVATQFSDTSAPTHYAYPEPQQIADELARIGVGEGRSVVIYDQTGTMWAARLWYLLRWIGVDARVLDGGLAAFERAGHALASGQPQRPTSVPTWTARAVRAAWISKEALSERGESDLRTLVCSLPASSFDGSVATRYARRGRIPGSVNVSSRDLFGSAGRLKSRLEVILAYRAAGVDVASDASEVLLYCGGGISAAAGALTLAAVGVDNVRIYDGSLEEWSADERMPLEMGPMSVN
ncbi:MAG: sulfurtransferase [Microbacteriaceae bacterium]